MATGELPPNADSQVIKGELLDMRALPVGLLTKLLGTDELPMLRAEYLRSQGKQGRSGHHSDPVADRAYYARAEERVWSNPLTGKSWGTTGHFRYGHLARTNPHFDDDITTIGMSRAGLFNAGECIDGRQEQPEEPVRYPWGTTHQILDPKVLDELLARLKDSPPQE